MCPNESALEITLNLPASPPAVTIDGVPYRRVDDDPAVELLRRIQRISEEVGVSRLQAAWAVKAAMVGSDWPADSFPAD